ncbi:hypothetical protein B0H10DRAFT_1944744 [Mycena sp. CBHHK59/15]|nr:hypothetical protein B0H10DRAFT_1944744 [Mycena sp. CBHHK59/15]
MVLYKESALTSLGILVTRDVGSVAETLRRKDLADLFPVSNMLGWAQVFRWNTGDSKIFADPSLLFHLPEPTSESHVRRVDVKSADRISLQSPGHKGLVRIETRDRLINTFAIPTIMIQPDLTEFLPFILNRIAHCRFNLGRQMPPATAFLQAPLISCHVALEIIVYAIDMEME